MYVSIIHYHSLLALLENGTAYILYMCVCVCVCVCVYAYMIMLAFVFQSIFHIGEKNAAFVFLNLAYFT
jgi:hypothetical protein